jgi:elongin-A
MAGAQPSAKQRQVAFARRMGVSRAPYDPPRSDASSKKKSIFTPTKINSALTMPTKSLNNRASQIKRAPIALVEEHRRPAPAPKPAPPPKAPAPSTTQPPPPRISRRPGMLPPSLQHPMLAQTGSRPRPISKTTITAPRATSSAGGSSNVSATKKPATASSKPEPQGSADSHPLPSPPTPTTKASPSTLPTHPTSERPPSSGPAPPRQGVIRRRPAPSIFMPAKRRRVS